MEPASLVDAGWTLPVVSCRIEPAAVDLQRPTCDLGVRQVGRCRSNAAFETHGQRIGSEMIGSSNHCARVPMLYSALS